MQTALTDVCAAAGLDPRGAAAARGGGLPGWAPLDDVRRRLSDAEGLADADRDFLLTRADELAEQLAAVRFELPTAVVHGDAHLGNLIRARDGRILLCDFDS